MSAGILEFVISLKAGSGEISARAYIYSGNWVSLFWVYSVNIRHFHLIYNVRV